MDRFVFLDGVRGLAALIVLTRHSHGFWGFKFFHGYLAVDVFFLLSGFVIASAYEKKLESGRISGVNFIWIRIIRFYPVYLISVLLGGLWALVDLYGFNITGYANVGQIVASIALALFYMPSVAAGSNNLYPMNGVYWSLAYELIVNIIYAAIRPLLSRVVLGFVVVISGLLLIGIGYRGGSLDIGASWGKIDIVAGFSRAVFGIFLGILLFRHFGALARWRQNGCAWLSLFAILLILMLPDLGRRGNVAADLLAIFLVFPLAVIGASRAVSSRLGAYMSVLGAASYPIYALHLPLTMIIEQIWGREVAMLAPFSGCIYLVLIVLLSYWIEKKFDEPLRARVVQILLPGLRAKA